jgi:hypothetical protein
MMSNLRRRLFGQGACILGTVAAAISACAQRSPPPAGLTVAQVVDAALHNYPSVRVTQEQMNAAAAGIRLAQTAYLPRIDSMARVNRAVRNTFYGLLPPQGVIPGVDGVKANNLGTVWDSGVPPRRAHMSARRQPPKPPERSPAMD